MWSGPATSDFFPSSNYRSAKVYCLHGGRESRLPRKVLWVAMIHWQHPLWTLSHSRYQ